MNSQSSSRWRRARALTAILATIALVGTGAVAASATPSDTAVPTATASLSGTVTDAATGAAIAGASVVILSSEGSEAGSASSGSTGGYTVSGLAPGEYRVSISAASGYEPVFWPSAASLGGAEIVTLAESEARTGVDAALTAIAVAEPPAETEPLPVDTGDPQSAVFSLQSTTSESAATGSITGTVTRAGTGAPVADVAVYALWSGSSDVTAADGTYALEGLDPGDYRVQFSPALGSGLSEEYWDGVHEFASATPVSVASGATVSGIDASLEATGSITGTVTRADTGAPVSGVRVFVHGPSWAGDVVTGADGTYTVDGLSPGAYRVQFFPLSAPDLIGEYWDGVHDWTAAAPVTVSGGATVTGIDASLVVGATISGQVRFDGPGYAWGSVVVSGSSGYFFDSFYAAPDGSYSVKGIPAGEYIVYAQPNGDTDVPVARQFYDGADSAAEARVITVVSGADITGIDFDLVVGVQITGSLAVAHPNIAPWGEAAAYRWNGAAWNEIIRITAWGDYAFSSWHMSGPSQVLPPGTYTVGFEYPDHCPQFWDAKASLATADSFALASGATKSGVNALLTTECDTPAVTPGIPTVSGTPQVGETLTANPGTWGPDPVELTYEWLADGTPIAGQTGTTLVLAAAQEGAFISVKVTGTRPGYTSATATSAAVGPVVGAPLPPVTPGTPTITGTPVAGSLLTASPGSWAPADVTLAYQWAADGAPIAGATGTTFVPGSAEVGAMITVIVTGSKTGYIPASATSAPFGPITAAPLLDLTVGSPTVTGTPKVGEPLTAVPGTWGPAPVTLTYQWLVGGEPVPGATGVTFTPDADAVGKTVEVTVLGTKPGYNPASATSPEVGPVAPGDLITVVPTIAGTPRVDDPLTADPGQWGPGAVELSYQWLVDGVPVDGATGLTFTPGAEHLGGIVTVEVTGTKPGYTTATERSAPTGPVAPGILSVSDPRVVGKPLVGVEVSVDASDWGPKPLDLAYQWLADGEPIEGATADRFTPDASLVGTVLSVTVSATKPGYEPAARTVVVGAISPSVTVSPPRAQRGDEVVVTGAYFTPGEDVLLELHSEPIELGVVVADDEGGFTTTVTVPQNAELGSHDVVATGLESGLVGSAPLEVYDPAAPPSGGSSAGTGAGGLPATGGTLPVMVLSFGILLVALGSVLAWRRRATS